MEEQQGFLKPRWVRDLERFLPLKSQFVLSGNVRDLQIVDFGAGTLAPVSMIEALEDALFRAGYSATIVFDPTFGFRAGGPDPERQAAAARVMEAIGLTPSNGQASGGMDLFRDVLDRFVAYDGAPIALLVDFASRLVVRNDNLSEGEHRLFGRGLVLSHQAQPRPFGQDGRPYFNTVVWVVDKEGDLPDWFVVNNPRVRHIPVAKPDHLARRAVSAALLNAMPGAAKTPQLAKDEARDRFVEETEGLLLMDLKAITQLGRTEGVEISRIGEAVRRYKVGITEDPWRKIDRDKIRNADTFIRKRVKGQSQAVTHMLDIIKRSITGVGAARGGGRPRGVAFLAGPTGVGKTELAKTVTELLFGDENAYIRFDMSEFSSEHSDQRLIGAPPGYIGYDAGGELTNAIREKPFSVVLFDEIEKAHPRILDKFLQILGDGVLTSGRGDRVYFSEAFIVFTSNLGIYRIDQYGDRAPNVKPDDDFEVVRERVVSEIQRYFKVVLNRPEILNRIGENLIVFDFVRQDVAIEILDSMVDRVLRDLKDESGVTVTIAPDVVERLRATCLEDMSNGGRGIRNKLEAHLVNPLARALFDMSAEQGSRYEVSSITPGEVTSLALSGAQGELSR